MTLASLCPSIRARASTLAYRRILERRAQENGVDFVNAVATAITPMAFFETIMAKGYETLVDPDTKVDVATGMIAAGRLQTMIESRAGRTSMAEILAQIDRIINAIHDTVPGELWPKILEKIGGPVAADRLTDEFEECEDAEDMYDPIESAKADGDCWTATARRDSPVEGHRAPLAQSRPHPRRYGNSPRRRPRTRTTFNDGLAKDV